MVEGRRRWLGEDAMRRAGKMELGVFSLRLPVTPAGTKENVNANVLACYRKQYPLAIICTSICEEREEAEREENGAR